MVNQLDTELQLVLEAGDFESALPLIEEYGKAAIQAAHQATTLSEQAEILRETAAFLQDRLHLARVMRAQLASQIAFSSRLAHYGDAASFESSWQLDG